MKIEKANIISVQDWDRLVVETYRRPYSFQQQNGCQPRGIFRISIPDDEACDFENDSILEKVNHEEMGVSFRAWLNRDPKQPLKSGENESYCINLWWERNFYPSVEVLGNDLYSKGLLEKGDYIIEIDW